MTRICLLTLLHVAIYSCFTGSKVLLSLLALKLGASQLLVGLLVACYAVAPLTLGVFSGRLADTIGMRVPMLIGALFMGAAMLTGYFWHTLAALYVTAFLVGIGFVFFVVSTQNLAGALAGNRTRNYAILAIGYLIANLVGPLVAGFSSALRPDAPARSPAFASSRPTSRASSCRSSRARLAPRSDRRRYSG